MKILPLIFVSFFIFQNLGISQISQPPQEDKIFVAVRNMPLFPGCEELEDRNKQGQCSRIRLNHFIHSNLIYPTEARKKEIEGTVVVSFVVEKDGSLTNPKIINGLENGCNEKVMKMVKSMPKWMPGLKDGQPIRVQYNLPVSFKLKEPRLKEITSVDSREIDEKPIFPGCENESKKAKKKREKNSKTNCPQYKFLEFLYTRILYPPYARENKIQGEVIASLTIEKDGTISNSEIIKGIGGGCNEEVLRIISLMPKWIPGKHEGEIVRTVNYTFPINFKLL